MRIIQLISSLGSGGAESVVRDYALGLQEGGNEVCVVMQYWRQDNGNEIALAERGIPLRSFYEEVYHANTINPVVRTFRKIKRNKATSTWLLGIVRDFAPDVIHVHLDMLKYLAPIADELRGIRLFYTCHNEPEFFFSDSSEKEAASKLIETCRMRLIALHEPMRSELNRIFDVSDTLVLNNPVDINRFSQTFDPIKIREWLKIPKDAFVIGHVGRFEDQKNHAFICEIFKAALKQNPGAFLLLVGDGSMKEKTIKTLESFTERFIVLSNRSDMPEMYAAMDVFILPSRFEGLPVTLIEAQAGGKRCVIASNITRSAVVSDNVTSLNVDDNASEWADAALYGGDYLKTDADIRDFEMRNIIFRLAEVYTT